MQFPTDPRPAAAPKVSKGFFPEPPAVCGIIAPKFNFIYHLDGLAFHAQAICAHVARQVMLQGDYPSCEFHSCGAVALSFHAASLAYLFLYLLLHDKFFLRIIAAVSCM